MKKGEDIIDVGRLTRSADADIMRARRVKEAIEELKRYDRSMRRALADVENLTLSDSQRMTLRDAVRNHPGAPVALRGRKVNNLQKIPLFEVAIELGINIRAVINGAIPMVPRKLGPRVA